MRRLRSAVSEALMAAVLAYAAFSPYAFGLRDGLGFGLMVEGGFLLMQGTLVDIATRLKKRPPVWLIVIIVAGVVLLSREAMGMLRVAWDRGIVVFIPLLVSIAQRGSSLWHMPDKSREEKIAARALIANRTTTALVLFALLTAAMLVGTALPDYHDVLTGPMVFLGAGALYFAIAAFDAWRVRGKKFAEKPTVLFRFDPIHITYLDPL